MNTIYLMIPEQYYHNIEQYGATHFNIVAKRGAIWFITTDVEDAERFAVIECNDRNLYIG